MAKIRTITEVAGTKIDPGLAETIFLQVEAFANYGFNRSHAAAYGVIGFQTAYLKAHYPHEFYASSMNLDLHNIEKLAEFAKEMRRVRLPFSGPDVNRSQVRFSVERDENGAKRVRWALTGIKGVGETAMRDVLEERQQGGAYASFQDFVRRTAGKTLNKKAYEGLIRAGALDSLHPNRAEMLKNLDSVLANATADAKSKNSGQVSLFDFIPAPVDNERMVSAKEMNRFDLLQGELEMLGFYLTGHPIEEVEDKLARRRGRATISQALDPRWKPMGRETPIGALLADLRIRTTRKGDPMAILKLSDPTGLAEAVMFPNDFARLRSQLVPGTAFVFMCGIENEKDEMGNATETRKLIARNAEPLRLRDDLEAA